MVLLSVLTPSYNYEEFLEDALNSVACLGDDVQHVVVDDGSTDASPAILGSRQGILYSRQPNAGLAATLNNALERATGEWVGWLNADDFYMPWTLDVLRQQQQFSDVDVIYGDSVFVDERGRFIRLAAQHPFRRAVLERYGPFIAPPAFFVRRRALECIRWDESTIKLMDWDLYLQLVGGGFAFRHVPVPLGAFRRHSRQQTHRPTPRAETLHVRARHGLTASDRRWRVRRFVGGVNHSLLKAIYGAYYRERRARDRLTGEDVRWWRSDDARDTIRLLKAGN